jgi:hypothetical protein
VRSDALSFVQLTDVPDIIFEMGVRIADKVNEDGLELLLVVGISRHDHSGRRRRRGNV